MNKSVWLKFLCLLVALWPIGVVAIAPDLHSKAIAEHFFQFGFMAATIASCFVSAFGLLGGTAQITLRKAIGVLLLAIVFVVVDVWAIICMTFQLNFHM